MSDPIGQTGKTVELVGKILEVVGENEDTKHAAQSLARSARTIATTLEVCLLPFAAITFGYAKAKSYFENEFASDLNKKLESLPPDSIIEPKALLAAPIVQGLGLSIEEPSLKEMYLNLLASTMDSRDPEKAHPSFASIIGQLTPDEAAFIKGILQVSKMSAVVNLGKKLAGRPGQSSVVRHLISVAKNQEVYWGRDIAFMLDNIQRLGLVEIGYDAHLTYEKAYDWVEQHSVYIAASQDLAAGEELVIQKGFMRLTHFGEGFLKAVVEEPTL
ncbi:Protein of unknown function DUF4393 [Paracoccaceae bacterium]